ncbi:hypothetical protein AMATHDRAFT_150794 [Amanita thiersii Skay4041]|uniref:non-specific serine/threonine protein kinase n=1 Tax=Amanita thiersii Skay4041 TaxID=703135 RepID=A0A2A9NBL4_9AGAR|nr:hypothetical protein AMATHDRAFT_150794 [Amanita thiersii Skay4041]
MPFSDLPVTTNIKKSIPNVLKIFQHRPWTPSPVVAPPITGSQLVEEEQVPSYDPRKFYPASIGEVLNNRYQLATKLGYGSHLTVRLARDLFQWRWLPEWYVAVKINTMHNAAAENELHISRILTNADSQHVGRSFVRTLLDSFTFAGPSGDRICLVFTPLREPLWLLKRRYEGGTIHPELIRYIAIMVLQGLDYMHRVCHITHGDLTSDNIMVKLEDKAIPGDSALDEYVAPLPQKKSKDRIIYLSRNDYCQPRRTLGIVTITDVGLSVEGDELHYERTQPRPYLPPEVILGTGWTYSADIWNLGIVLYELMEDKILERVIIPSEQKRDKWMLFASMTALMGPAPQELLAKGKNTPQYYDLDGNPFKRIDGDGRLRFARFLQRMLKWKPEERCTAKQLLNDPWLEEGSMD